MAVENFTTKVDNLRQDSPEWVKENIKNELSLFQKEMFYEIKGDQVEYHMDTVVSYLESIKNLSWKDMKDKGAAWVMSVQIALESIKDENGNSKYDVGKIDGLFGRNTRNAVRKFQEDCGFTGKDLDGYPGPMTIGKLLEKLGAPAEGGAEAPAEGGAEAPAEGGAEAPAEATKLAGIVEGGNSEVDEGSVAESEENTQENLKKFNSDVFKVLSQEFNSVLKELNLIQYLPNAGYASNSNPKLGVQLRVESENGGYPSLKGVMINLHDYVGEDGVLQRKKLKQDIDNMNKEYAMEVKKQREESEDSVQFLNFVKNVQFSFEDLFGKVNEGSHYKAFFDKFSRGILKIDRDNTYFTGDKLHIELDKRYYNLASRCRHDIDKSELKGEDGKYSKEKFNEKMKEIVTKIVNEKFGDGII